MAATDYDFQSSRTDIIQRALQIVGAIGYGDPVSAEHSAAAVIALNQIVKAWQNEHIYLWTVAPLEITLVVGQEDYALPSDPAVLWIERAYFRNSSNQDSPELQIVEYSDYLAIVDKASQGTPLLLALDSQPSPTAYLWPVPNEAKTLYCETVRKLKDWDAPDEHGDFDGRWDLALTWALAAELAPENGIRANELLAIQKTAGVEFLKAKGGNREHVTRTSIRSAFPFRRRR